jgi:hypothetical protein
MTGKADVSNWQIRAVSVKNLPLAGHPGKVDACDVFPTTARASERVRGAGPATA